MYYGEIGFVSFISNYTYMNLGLCGTITNDHCFDSIESKISVLQIELDA